MDNFQFVTVTNPTEIKDKRHQKTIRAHAIRTTLKKTRDKAVQSQSNFVAIEVDPHDHSLIKKRVQTKAVPITPPPSAGRLDPFDCLPASPERLRVLMRTKYAKQAAEPIFCVDDTGTMLFQGMDTVIQGALTDPALFHALSLVLAFAANRDVPNVECLVHRGELLGNLGARFRRSMGNPDSLTKYRVEGEDARDNISMHIKAADKLIRWEGNTNGVVHGVVQRALFWQDLYGSLLIGTTRILSHEQFPEWCWDLKFPQTSLRVVPQGFQELHHGFPTPFTDVLADLNTACALIDDERRKGRSSLYELRIDDAQAWIESRITNLVAEWRGVGVEDPLYEASLLVTFYCTYNLSTAIWEGCYVLEWCARNALRALSKTKNRTICSESPKLLTWLLFAIGALAKKRETRLQSSLLILSTYRGTLSHLHEDWLSLKGILQKFIWSEHTMESKYYEFWAEIQAEWISGDV
ncbi:hypothetical protein K491DRAFT_713055 [Lophiostoma macrostomum CBS 122681]|uniref:Uncharacterized protein n=1 Tax=Lophiostoma macrostomum CBS 122681 TaxID=1314788 RepID=A0A6A6TGE4_9PLEO|nr:hypothetical protein K491DRAFT_713055 [Lophiostoma macrostomum CBS 122681]